MGDVSWLEDLAVESYERAGLDPSRPTSSFKVARLLYGENAVIRPPEMMVSPAALITVDGERRVAVKKGIPLRYARFFVGHELGHLELERIGYVGDKGASVEECCDYYAAALMAPRPATRALQRVFGFDLPSIAKAAGSTETWAALRVGEVMRQPIAVVAPRVRVRGPEEWVWPDESTIRGWVRRLPPGLAKARLRDDPRRVALIADAV